MFIPSRIRAYFLGVFVASIPLASSVAQNVETASPPPAVPAATSTELTVEELQSRLQQLETATGLSQEAKDSAGQLYEQALSQLQLAEKYAQEVAEWKSETTAAPDLIASMKEKLAKPAEEVSPEIPEATAAELEQLRVQVREELTSAQNRLQELEQEPARRAERRLQVATLQQQAQQRLADLEKSSATPPLPGESPEISAAQQTLRQATKLATEQEIAMLGEELPQYEKTKDLIDLQRQLAARDVQRAEEKLEAWDERIRLTRQEETQAQEEQVRQARIDAAGKHPAIASLAEENFRLSERRAGPENQPEKGLTAKIEKAKRDIKSADEKLKEIAGIEAELEKKRKLTGIAAYSGPWLRQQRGKLPRSRDLKREISLRQQEVAQAGQSLLEFQRRKTELENVEDEVQVVVNELDDSTPPKQREEIAQAAKEQLQLRAQLAKGLADDYTTYFDRLNDVTSKQQELVTQSDVLRQKLNESLLWVQATPPMRPHEVKEAGRTLAWLAKVIKAAEFRGDFWQSVTNRPLQVVLAGLAVLALVAGRRTAKESLRELGELAARSYLVPFSTTFRAFMLTIVLTALWPAVVACVGWCLYSNLSATAITRGVGAGLLASAVVYVALEFTRQLLCSGGLAEAHFRWDAGRVRLIRRHLRWLAVCGLPLVLLLTLIEWDGDLERQASLGRILFVTVMLLVALFMQRILRPVRPTTEDVPQTRPNFTAKLIQWIAIGAPLLIAAFSIVGYHFTACELSVRLLQTFYLGLILVVLQGMALRWLRLVRGELALEQARQRRAAQQQAAKGEVTGFEEAESEVTPEIDLQTVNQQTRRLLQLCVAAVGLAGLWLIWLDVLPGKPLRQHVVWRGAAVTEVVKPADETAPPQTAVRYPAVTISDVILAALMGLVAFVAAKNMPGLVEVGLPQSVPLDAGARYALSTLIRYSIAAVGMVLIGSTLGFSWSRVQWLVAALSVGVGFGLQELVANFISGLILLFERPVRVGDIVTVDTVTGMVTRVQIRATTIRNWDRQEYIVPNKDLITGRLLNWTLSNQTNRIVIPVGVAYGSDTRHIRQLLLEILREHSEILDDPTPLVTFEQFGDSSLNLVIRACLPSLDNRMETIHELHTQIHERFAKEGIEIAFPQRDLHIRTIEQPVRVTGRDEATLVRVGSQHAE